MEMKNERPANLIVNGETSLGIEFGSTRIKMVLIDEAHNSIAAGAYNWENRQVEGIWTYSQEDILKGLQECFGKLADEVKNNYRVTLKKVGAIGISGMMHGYLAFDSEGNLLVPFRTWRNTMTEQASKELTALFGFNIPERWSIAHLYQAMLNGEDHVRRIAFLTTLSGYLHWQLTGQKVLGIGDASGVFPIDIATKQYDAGMLNAFDELISTEEYPWSISDVLPKILVAGNCAGTLTERGAKLLDPGGNLEAGIPFCPPEGDAGTGMVATNSVKPRTGNVSAGTSVFSMVVLEKKLCGVYPQIDLVTTPSGEPVAMVHCNNCSGELDAWVKIFEEFSKLLGVNIEIDAIYSLLYKKALEGEPDCGGLISYNYSSGEPVTGLREGRPLFTRMPDSRMNLANFMRTQLLSAIAALKAGMDILINKEGIGLDKICAHGGLFKTEEVCQRLMSAALNSPVRVMPTAGEGGAWGIAVLANYMRRRQNNEKLSDYLEKRVFKGSEGTEIEPNRNDILGFEAFMNRYIKCLPIEKTAVECFREGQND